MVCPSDQFTLLPVVSQRTAVWDRNVLEVLSLYRLSGKKWAVPLTYPSSALPTESSNAGQSRKETPFCGLECGAHLLVMYNNLSIVVLPSVSTVACTVNGHDEQAAPDPPTDSQLHGKDGTRAAIPLLLIMRLLIKDVQSGKHS